LDLRSLDTETTGLDLHHGAKPYLITTCDLQDENMWWEWDVNPLNREPIVPKKELLEVKKVLRRGKNVLHNSKFDAKALHQIGVELDWSRVEDTLVAAHLYHSSSNKDLTALALKHLKVNVLPYEEEIKRVTTEARQLAKKEYPSWRISTPGLPDMPSIKASSDKEEDKPWKSDMWLPRAIAKDRKYPEGHPWWEACSNYANSDTAVTIGLYRFFRKWMKEEGYISLYKERLKALPILFDMEMKGITYNHDRLEDLRSEYKEEYDRKSTRCKIIAGTLNFELELPKAAMNNSLREFCFDKDKLNLPVIKRTKSGGPSLDKSAKEDYLVTLGGRQLNFLKSLNTRGKLATSLGYMESYEKFSLPMSGFEEEWRVLHSSLNLTGTSTLRMSSHNPNQQQISKLEDELHGRNLRYLFGPPPGKEWWSLDYDNLELRIPAYECKEPAMLELFEFPDNAPFFGSYHMLIVSILYPEEWGGCLRKAGPEGAAELFKKRFKSTLYQWTKNGNFAEMYGAIDRDDGEGTADKAYHMKGAQKRIASKLMEKKKLNEKYIHFAQQNGFVYTLPDSEVSPEHGYPLMCSRVGWGKIKPTIPLNYHVQGTACWVMMRAMTKIHSYLSTLGEGYRIVMNVHDEVVLEMPYRKEKGNLPKLQKVKKLMESMGPCVGVKLTCGIDYHPNSWSQTV
jgi:DNA polymerase I-like protein with 3'-5' exonuclease and polymerase domains